MIVTIIAGVPGGAAVHLRVCAEFSAAVLYTVEDALFHRSDLRDCTDKRESSDTCGVVILNGAERDDAAGEGAAGRLPRVRASLCALRRIHRRYRSLLLQSPLVPRRLRPLSSLRSPPHIHQQIGENYQKGRSKAFHQHDLQSAFISAFFSTFQAGAVFSNR
jgi:hypothetical protein